jgi:cytochrome P450
MKYYGAEHDLEPDVSQMVKGRAATFRKYGIASADIGKFEIGLLNVSTANAIPSLFWLLCNVCADRSLTQSIRSELAAMVTHDSSKRQDGKRELSFDVTKFESHCPLLVSSYRETLRLANAQMGTRRVMRDTTISDGQSTYLLKEGCDVQIPSGIAHLSPEFWGSDSTSFNPRRFVAVQDDGAARSQKNKDEEKVQNRAYFPFGGGKHLCPGRNFAFAEILGTVAVLVLGFEVEKVGGGAIVMPAMGRTQFGEAVAKPRGESAKMNAKISKRKGWEDVVWKFVC